jgi:hypothetical protein
VITDSLEMAGARGYAQGKGGGFAGSFERSLLAGSDLLLHTHPIPETVEIEGASQPVMSFNVMETIIRTLEKVVDRGRIDEKLAEAAERSEALQNLLEILERSTDRIVALRGRLSEMPEPPRAVTRGSKVIEFNAYPSVPAVYRRVAEESISLWGSAPLSAIPPDAECLVVPVEWCPSQFLKKHDLDAFIDVLCKRFPRWGRTEVASSFVLGEDGTHRPDIKPGPTVVDAQRFTGSDLPRGADLPEAEAVVIVMSSRGIPPEEFTAGLEDFASQHELLTVIIVGWPVTDWVPEGCPALLCFGASAHVASAVSEILSGYAEPRGTISGLFPTGAP